MDKTLKLRLARSYAVLGLIDMRRAQTGDQGIGCAVEKRILDHELQDLEAASCDAPFGPPGEKRLTG